MIVHPVGVTTFKSFTLVLSAFLGGCVPTPPTRPILPDGQLITIENEPGPFCGRCDSIKVIGMDDGRVWIKHSYWAGRYTDWTTEWDMKRIAPENFAKFREKIRPYRPRGQRELQDKPPCTEFWTDMDGVRVEWRDASGNDNLILNFGCDHEANGTMANALRAAPSLLGIKGLKLPWGQSVATTPM